MYGNVRRLRPAPPERSNDESKEQYCSGGKQGARVHRKAVLCRRRNSGAILEATADRPAS